MKTLCKFRHDNFLLMNRALLQHTCGPFLVVIESIEDGLLPELKFFREKVRGKFSALHMSCHTQWLASCV